MPGSLSPVGEGRGEGLRRVKWSLEGYEARFRRREVFAG